MKPHRAIQNRINNHLSKTWETGTQFSDQETNHTSKMHVLREFGIRNYKNLTKAKLILSSVILELAVDKGLNKEDILTFGSRKKTSNHGFHDCQRLGHYKTSWS